MKRSDFLKAAAMIGAATSISLPSYSKSIEVRKIAEPQKPKKLIIDLKSISINNRLTAKEVLRIYHETGMLIWDSSKGESPMLIDDGTPIQTLPFMAEAEG